MAKDIIITIDGPAGAGKSTTARKVAETLGYLYIDTGAMYRAVTLAVLRSGVNLDESSVSSFTRSLVIHLKQDDKGQRTTVNGDDVTEAIRDPKVTQNVSLVSSYPEVRTLMVRRQRELAARGGIVMDGRDIGTVVFPDAQVKVFLVADIDERTKRRAADLRGRGIDVDEAVLKQEIIERDTTDSSRSVSPLIKADDATEIDTTNLSIDEQVEKIVKLARAYIKADSLISQYLNF